MARKRKMTKNKKKGKDFENPFENNIFASVKEEGSRTHRFLFYSPYQARGLFTNYFSAKAQI